MSKKIQTKKTIIDEIVKDTTEEFKKLYGIHYLDICKNKLQRLLKQFVKAS
jgi:hypothetical protein